MKSDPARSFEFFSSTRRELIDLSKPVLISCESYVPFTQNNVVSDDGLILYIDFMYFDEISRNLNIYPADDTLRSFKESVWIQENLRNRTLYGEAGHPPANADMDRFLRIEESRLAWNILSIEYHRDKLAGNVGLCAPMGLNIVLPNFKMYGANYGASCRISTPNYVVKDRNGQKIYVKKYKMYPITIDCISVGSTGIAKCRLIKDGQYQPDPINVNTGLHDVNVPMANKDIGSQSYEDGSGLFNAVFTDPAGDLLKNVASSTEAARIVSDIFGIDFDHTNAILTKDNKIRMSTESGATATIPLNSYLVSQILR